MYTPRFMLALYFMSEQNIFHVLKLVPPQNGPTVRAYSSVVSLIIVDAVAFFHRISTTCGAQRNHGPPHFKTLAP